MGSFTVTIGSPMSVLTERQQEAVDDYVTQCMTHWHPGAVRTLVALEVDRTARLGPKALQWAVQEALDRYQVDPGAMIVAWLERDTQTIRTGSWATR